MSSDRLARSSRQSLSDSFLCNDTIFSWKNEKVGLQTNEHCPAMYIPLFFSIHVCYG